MKTVEPSTLVGFTGMRAVLYRALAETCGMSAPEADRHELWQLAVALGLDIDDGPKPGTRLHPVLGTPLPVAPGP